MAQNGRKDAQNSSLSRVLGLGCRAWRIEGFCSGVRLSGCRCRAFKSRQFV